MSLSLGTPVFGTRRRLYSAYPSDSESDTDTASSDYTQRSDVTTNYLVNIPGTQPPQSSGYEAPGKAADPPKDTGTNLGFTTADVTSLFMLNSRDRDTNAYPLPTFFTLRLPRVYKNVKSISLNQINLLNSFFNFTAQQQNTTMYVYEQGRVLADGTSSNIIPVTIPDGTYNATDLVTALNNAMNATPLFANITFTAFLSSFQQSGNFTLLFNTPGYVVFNVLTNSYDTNLTINDIVNRYFQTSQTAGTFNFSYNETLVAYYYPVMYQMIATANITVPFNTTGLTIPAGFTSWYDYILFGFAGLNDANILAIINEPGNQTLFDDYRYANTFNTSLVNFYNCSYNSQQGRLVISAPSLNTSIANDLSTQYSNILNALITSCNFNNIDQFNQQYSNFQNSNYVIVGLYNYLQGQFTSNFGIDFGTYSAGFFGNSNNQIELYNTQNEFGWNTSLNPGFSLVQINSNTPVAQTSNYWPNLIFPKNAATPAISTFVSTIVPSSFPIVNGIPQLYFSNAGEETYGYTDIVYPILPASYVRTSFSTPYRQNISLMTIPRYINNRGAGTQEVYNFNVNTSTPSLLFDVRTKGKEYVLTDISGVSIFDMYTVVQSMFNSEDYMRAYDRWQNFMFTNILAGARVQIGNPNYNRNPPIGDINLTSFRPFIFFQVNADQYPISPNALFNIDFFVETQDGTPFPSPITITWYKDRAAFMADALLAMPTVNVNTENPRNYFQTQTYTGNSAVMTVQVTNLQQTYFYVHYAVSGNQSSVQLRVFSVLTNPYGVYTQATQNDLLNMPYANLPPLSDQFTPDSSVYLNNLISIYSTTVTSLGYDISGVSNNLTDYIIVAPNNNFYDPTNIETYTDGVQSGVRYQFNLSNMGAPTPAPNLVPPWSLYFGSNSANAVLDLYNTSNIIYLQSNQPQTFPNGQNYIANNEFTIASFLDYTLPTNKEIFLSPGQDVYMPVNSTTIFQPCINYDSPIITDSSTCLAFADTTGIAGLSFFMPPANIISLSQFIVKFAYTGPTQTDNQTNITTTVSPFQYYGYDNVTQGINNNWVYNNSATALTNTILLDTGVIEVVQQPVDWAYFTLNFNTSLCNDIQALFTVPVPDQPGNFTSTTPINVTIRYLPFNSAFSFLVESININDLGGGIFYVSLYGNTSVPAPQIFPSYGDFYYNTTARFCQGLAPPWDDWYLWNRINTKIAIFPSAQIQGVNPNTLALSSALFTMTLNQVTQVCQNTNNVGTVHTREPDWGTYYEYTIQPTSTLMLSPVTTNISSYFTSISVPADITPTYIQGSNTYPGYALTPQQIYNYTYLPRSYGIAPSVGNAVNNPYPGIQPYTADIANSYTAVPFAYNVSTNTWGVSAFYALSYTRQPALPSTGLIGGAPYYGPPGIFGWNIQGNVFTLYNGEQATFQPYYWLGKIGFNTLTNINYNPATDLSSFGGYAGLSGEYQDTLMFFYGNSTIGGDYRDISTSQTRWRWGYENKANYLAFDDQSGYNFLSYLTNLSVRPTVKEYAVHVRGYDPIPQFTTGLRIIGNNYTDFGNPTLGEIGTEISSLTGYQPISDLSGSLYLQNTAAYNQIISTNNGIRLNNGNRFSHAYADALTIFNAQVAKSSITFGTTTGFAGSSFSFTGYADAIGQYVDLYTTVTTQYALYTSILSTTTGLLNQYVIARYGNILPPGIVNRSNYAAAIPFQLLFNYNLNPPYNTQLDQWGLGWYLGFPKLTVPVIGPRTLVTSATFIRIVQQYIYLRLNPAQNVNTLAVSAKEDLSQTRESQGMDTQYFTKIILNDFASYCRAGVQLDKVFSPVLGKYEVIECQLTDQNGNILSNVDCDYDMVIQITETANVANNDSSLIGPFINTQPKPNAPIITDKV